MNDLGKRIKELRKKNDLTQEKLADMLGITYKAVSKWECGMTSPDISMIVPLARILCVTTDELLGLVPIEKDERKAYFDAEYHQFWNKEHEEDLGISRQAVKEYPNDMRYVYWLASNEYYVGYDCKYMGTDTEKQLLESSAKHYETVLENTDDYSLRKLSIHGLMHVYKGQGKHDDAKNVAMLYPEEDLYCRDNLLAQCLKGEELFNVTKRIVKNSLLSLCNALDDLYMYTDNAAVLDAEEAIINTIITDGNYQHFHCTLSHIYKKHGVMAMKKGDKDKAIEYMTIALDHAKRFDDVYYSNIEHYTCPVLQDYHENHTNDRKDEYSTYKYIRDCLDSPIFEAIKSNFT